MDLIFLLFVLRSPQGWSLLIYASYRPSNTYASTREYNESRLDDVLIFNKL